MTAVNCDPHARPDGATTTTGQLVTEIFQTASEPQKSIEILLKLVTNAMANPKEPKFQEVRKANNVVRTNIVGVSPCAMLLRRCGFVDRGEHFRLQASGLRLGELSRITVALAEYTQTKELSTSLNESMLRHMGFNVILGPTQERAPVIFVSAQEVQQAGVVLKRPGWTSYKGYDVDPYEDAHSMSALNIEACFQVAEENGFGGFCTWEGEAYFRESSGEELKQRLQKSPGAGLYIYAPARSSASAPSAAAGTGAADDDENDADLQEALRLSMLS